MRFLHTADWHIGKKLHGYDLLKDQQAVLQQILQIAKEEAVDAVVIAGDLYDRSVPSVEAVELLNKTLIEWNLEGKLPILAISGNHDSSTRLATGAPWFQLTDFHLVTELKAAFQPVIIGETQFFFLPYFEPIAARLYFDEDFSTIQEAVTRVVQEFVTLFDSTKKQVLISHFFIAGGLRTESETQIEVGGLNSVPAELFDVFDYVALGHLHSKNALKTGKLRYSGSPLKFSLSELNDQKGVWIVDADADLAEPVFKPLSALRDVRQMEASFAELLDPTFYQTVNRQDFWHILLTDRAVIPNMMNQLREIYPNILSVDRVHGFEMKALSAIKKREQAPQETAANFFEEITGEMLTKKQATWLEQGLQVANDAEKRND